MRRVVAFSVLLALGVVAWLVIRDRATPEVDAPSGGRSSEADGGAAASMTLNAHAARGAAAEASSSVATSDPSAELATYRLRVVSFEDGKPVAGATVWSDRDTSLGSTDEDGALQFTARRDAFPPGAWIAVRRQGFCRQFASPKPDGDLRIEMFRADRLIGRVTLASTGVPVANARVAAFAACDVVGPPVDDPVLTDSDGRFQIVGTMDGSAYEVVIEAPGRAAKWDHIRQVGREMEVSLSLEDGGVLEGSVVSSEGHALGDVLLTVVTSGRTLPNVPGRNLTSEFSWGYAAQEANRTRTDGAGRFRMAGLSLNTEWVPVAEAKPTLVGRGEPARFVSEGQVLRRNLVVPAPGSLRVVLDLGDLDARAQQRASVLVAGGVLDLYLPLRSRGPDGALRIAELTPGSYHVHLFLHDGPAASSRSVAVVPGRTSEVQITLRGGLSIEGQVVEAGGEPVPWPEIAWEGSGQRSTTGDEDGSFRLDGLEESPGTLTVVASWGQHPPSLSREVRTGVRPGGPPMRVVLSPVAHVRVRLDGVPSGDLWPTVAVSTPWFHAEPLSIRPDAEGRIEAPVTILGEPVAVTVSYEGLVPIRFETAALRSGEVRDLGSGRLDEGRDVTVRILGPGGAPQPGVLVAITQSQAGDAWAVADSAGVARMERMPQRASFVALSGEGIPLHVFPIPAAGSGPFDLRLEHAGTLDLRVVGRDGTPASMASVALLPPDEDPFDPEPDGATILRQADEHGALAVDAQPRRYRLHVRGARGDGEARLSGVVVRSGEKTTVTVELR